jgi:Ca2+/H+ antiporter
MSAELGQTLAGLLNATFGNAVEIIVGIAALLQGAFKTVFVLGLLSTGNMPQASCALSKLL